jgi:hypothetical protein
MQQVSISGPYYLDQIEKTILSGLKEELRNPEAIKRYVHRASRRHSYTHSRPSMEVPERASSLKASTTTRPATGSRDLANR